MARRLCKGGVWLMRREGEGGEVFYFYSPPCRIKGCANCSKMMQIRHMMRMLTAMSSLPDLYWSFVTATLRGKDHRHDASMVVIRRVWSKTRKRLGRRFASLFWVRVYEKHKSGIWHVHVILGTNGILSRKAFKAIWFASGGGYQVRVSKVNRENITYITKYATKGSEKARVIEYSRNFPKLPTSGNDEVSDLTWVYMGRLDAEWLTSYLDFLAENGAEVHLLTKID